VGFHLYTRLLARAVGEMRRSGRFGAESAAAQVSIYHPMINVDLPFELGIPAAYVPDKAMRLKLYRRLADLHDLAEIDALDEEFRDRFGPPPEETQNLLYQLKVRVMAEKAGVVSISMEGPQLALRYPAKKAGEDAYRFPALGAEVRTSKNAVWLPRVEGDAWRTRLLEVLEALGSRQVAGRVAA
jgi:transcription-repair coupling factor (superfamily II helicase)